MFILDTNAVSKLRKVLLEKKDKDVGRHGHGKHTILSDHHRGSKGLDHGHFASRSNLTRYA